MLRIVLKVGGQMITVVVLAVGLTLDGTGTAEITLGQQAIAWQWIALAGAALFVAASWWTQISLYRALTDHAKYRRAAIGIGKFIIRGNGLLDIHCRPESPSPVGQDITDWIGDTRTYIREQYPEGFGLLESDNIDFYDTSTPVMCRVIRGRLARLDEIDRELRLLAGGVTRPA